ncbi:unnamed protein product [Heterobilharzia americana]|nr:unnamed protein product [Heterobilharzia americana]
MHSLHYSVKPCQNKPLQKKFDLRYQNIHRRALFEMKPIVDTTAPKTFQLIHLNSKKHRMHSSQFFSSKSSLNARQRLKEVKRITRDNKELANRLKNCKNMYNHKKLEEDWLNTLTYMSNISKTGITYQKSISK